MAPDSQKPPQQRRISVIMLQVSRQLYVFSRRLMCVVTRYCLAVLLAH